MRKDETGTRRSRVNKPLLKSPTKKTTPTMCIDDDDDDITPFYAAKPRKPTKSEQNAEAFAEEVSALLKKYRLKSIDKTSLDSRGSYIGEIAFSGSKATFERNGY